MSLVISILVLLEILFLCAAAFVLFRRGGYRVSESVIAAIITTFMGLSCVIQAAFLLGVPRLSMLLEGLALVAAVYIIISGRKFLIQGYLALRAFLSAYRVISVLLAMAFAYLGAQALLLPEGNYDSMRYNLARVLLFQQDKSLFLEHITEYHQAVLPVGGDILTHLFLRFYTDYGVALFSFAAYLAMGFGTYALARSYASVSASLTAAIVAYSLPLLVHQATGTKPDILAAAAALFCLVLANRLYAHARIGELSLLILALSFGVSAKTTFLAFAVPFTILFGFILLRRHDAAVWKAFFITNWRILLVLILPVLILTNVWLFTRNYISWGHWFGPKDFVQFHRNGDGAMGAFANMGRYLLQSLHFLTPTDLLVKKISGMQLSDRIEQIYFAFLYPLWKDAGAAWPNKIVPFALSERTWGDSENGSWFGPLGCLLILPTMLYALFFVKHSFIRVLNLTLIAYAIIISWQIAWMPWNCRFLSLLFVCATCNVAILMDTLQHKQRLIKGIQVVAIAILFYSMVCNTQKPMTYSSDLHLGKILRITLKKNIWKETNYGRDRHYYNRRYFGDDRVRVCSSLIPPGAKVGVISYYLGWTFPFLLSRSDVEYLLFIDSKRVEDFDFTQDFSGLDYLLCINNDGRAIVKEGHASVIWKARAGASVREGALLKLPKIRP